MRTSRFIPLFAPAVLIALAAHVLPAQQTAQFPVPAIETAALVATDRPDSSSLASAPAEAALPDAPSAVVESADAPDPAYDFRTGRKGDIPLQDEDHPPVTYLRVPKMMVEDGAHIFVSPIYLRGNDLKWVLPLTGAAIGTFATDTRVMRDVVTYDPGINSTAGTVSDSLRDTYIAIPAFMAIGGGLTHNDHVQETGILGGEAMVDAFIVDEVIKVASFRERPTQDNAAGNFYVGSAGIDSSFISGHCMIAWSSAAVIAGEYNNKWVQAAAYTGATGIAVTRVMARAHFPTDVLLGSAGGFLIGHYVYRAHHHAPHGKMEKVAAVVVERVHIDM